MFLGGTGASTLPTNLHKLRGRVREILCDNSPMLRSISPDIGALASTLTRLDCSNCALESLPEEIGFLHCMQFLNLSNNKLSAFVWECELSNLIELDLSGNRIRYFSPQVSDVVLSRATVQLQSSPTQTSAVAQSSQTEISGTRRIFVDLSGNSHAFVKVSERCCAATSPSSPSSSSRPSRGGVDPLFEIIPPQFCTICAVCANSSYCRVQHVAVRFIHVGSAIELNVAKQTRTSPLVKFVPVLYPSCSAECVLALQRWQEWIKSVAEF